MSDPHTSMGLGDNTMRHRAVPAATMIVAASLIGITQARLPRPVRDYHDRVTVEMSALALHDTLPVPWSALQRAPRPVDAAIVRA
jgi:hypothetical protein